MPSETPDSILALLVLPIPDFVQKSYLTLLGRRAEPHELAARSEVLRTGWGRIRLLENIVSSAEFVARQQQAGDGSDRAFVEHCYQAYANRLPDQPGLSHYMDMLAAGKSRNMVRRDIFRSTEARAISPFWVELDSLLVDERKNMNRFGRWFGRSRRMERRRNLELEIIRSQNDIEGRQGRLDLKRADAGHHEPIQHIQFASAHARRSIGIDGSGLPIDARRMLSRLQHFRAETWPAAMPMEGKA